MSGIHAHYGREAVNHITTDDMDPKQTTLSLSLSLSLLPPMSRSGTSFFTTVFVTGRH
jgi:hypothetical protein